MRWRLDPNYTACANVAAARYSSVRYTIVPLHFGQVTFPVCANGSSGKAFTALQAHCKIAVAVPAESVSLRIRTARGSSASAFRRALIASFLMPISTMDIPAIPDLGFAADCRPTFAASCSAFFAARSAFKASAVC